MHLTALAETCKVVFRIGFPHKTHNVAVIPAAKN